MSKSQKVFIFCIIIMTLIGYSVLKKSQIEDDVKSIKLCIYGIQNEVVKYETTDQVVILELMTKVNSILQDDNLIIASNDKCELNKGMSFVVSFIGENQADVHFSNECLIYDEHVYKMEDYRFFCQYIEHIFKCQIVTRF